MVFRTALNTILDHFPLQNGFLDTDIGKTSPSLALFFQQIQAKHHFKKFFSSKWTLEPL
jgi:hypothetical protein